MAYSNKTKINNKIQDTILWLDQQRGKGKLPDDEINRRLYQAQQVARAESVDDAVTEYVLKSLNKNSLKEHLVWGSNYVKGVNNIEGYKLDEMVSSGLRSSPSKLAGDMQAALARTSKLEFKTYEAENLYNFLGQLAGADELKPGVYKGTFGQFTIDDGWRGSISSLKDHLHLKKINLDNADTTTMRLFRAVLSNPYMSDSLYEAFKAESDKKREKTFAKNVAKEFQAAGMKFATQKFIKGVATVIDQSHMWAVCSKDIPYEYNKNGEVTKHAGEHKERYRKLTEKYNELQKAEESGKLESGYLEQFIQMIENTRVPKKGDSKHTYYANDFDPIIAQVDEWLKEAYMK